MVFSSKSAAWLASSVALAVGVFASAQPTQEHPSFADVEKVFAAHCTRCHSGDSPPAGLDLSSYKGVMASGVVSPKDSKKSLLMVRVRGQGGMQQMPLGFTAISDREMAVIAEWIDSGALPGGEATVHWAYVAPVRPEVPKVQMEGWARNPIDAFVLARLEKEGLKPSPEADKTTLIRRVTLDLTGLPPTPREVDAFLRDKSKNAYEKVVDRLLASPHYGEKMALPWLDAARYADSNGFQMEGDTYQYVWRDWVIRAMNADMPFDKFTTQQIAGDLMPGVTQATKEGRDALIATGFNRNHMLNGEGGAIPEEQRNVNLFDRVETMSTTWLGLTMTCTRCHDHKYDPFTQHDYYSLMAYFNNVPETGVPEGGVPYSVAKPWIYSGDSKDVDRLHALESLSAVANEELKALEASPDTERREELWLASGGPNAPQEIQDLLKVEKRSEEQNKKLHAYFMHSVLRSTAWDKAVSMAQQLNDLKARLPRPMVMSDRNPRETHVLHRGNYTEPLEKVACGTPAILPKVDGPKNRLGLAEWIVSPSNPLTARVAVNHYWATFFGRGIVKTPENFGVQGSPPSHPKLLDWLAVEFVQSGWDVKRMHKLIVMSATYRQSSAVTPKMQGRDPDNELLARGARFRMPAMVLRDVALAASGLLNDKMYGKPVYPYQPIGIWDGLNITDERDFTYPQSHGPDLYRRSVYTFWRRTVMPGNMFDAATRNVCTVKQWVTSTPLHALTMLNDPTWVEAGRALAQRVMLAHKTPDERLVLAFRYVCSRVPRADELGILRNDLAKAREYFSKNPKAASEFLAVGESKNDPNLDPVEHAAYTTACLTILNLDEAMTRE